MHTTLNPWLLYLAGVVAHWSKINSKPFLASLYRVNSDQMVLQNYKLLIWAEFAKSIKMLFWYELTQCLTYSKSDVKI